MQTTVSERLPRFEVPSGAEPPLPRFSRKELDEETGFYYHGARYLNPKTSIWISADPAMSDYIPKARVDDEAKKHNENLPGMGGVYNYVNFHVYHYAGNNPVKYVDPEGRELEVTANENGTYTVTGGTLNRDKNIYIMKDGERTGVLGQTFTEYSFFDDNGKVFDRGAIIDPNDNSGQKFIDDIKSNTPSLLTYASSAKNGERYDFKSWGGNNERNHHRGMPIKNSDGNTVYASARDVGNYGAGYVVGKNGLTWKEARLGFDSFQSFKDGSLSQGKWSIEGNVSQSAQGRGFIDGRIRGGYLYNHRR
jgi:hypothetical protein